MNRIIDVYNAGEGGEIMRNFPIEVTIREAPYNSQEAGYEEERPKVLDEHLKS